MEDVEVHVTGVSMNFEVVDLKEVKDGDKGHSPKNPESDSEGEGTNSE